MRYYCAGRDRRTAALVGTGVPPHWWGRGLRDTLPVRTPVTGACGGGTAGAGEGHPTSSDEESPAEAPSPRAVTASEAPALPCCSTPRPPGRRPLPARSARADRRALRRKGRAAAGPRPHMTAAAMDGEPPAGTAGAGTGTGRRVPAGRERAVGQRRSLPGAGAAAAVPLPSRWRPGEGDRAPRVMSGPLPPTKPEVKRRRLPLLPPGRRVPGRPRPAGGLPGLDGARFVVAGVSPPLPKVASAPW